MNINFFLRSAKLIFSALFLLLLSLPAFMKLAHIQLPEVNTFENRKLASRPALLGKPLSSWPQLLNPWINDCLPGRAYFIRAYQRIWGYHLGAPVTAIKGKDGHFFNTLFLTALGRQPLSKEQLLMFKLSFAGMAAFWQLQDTPYFMVFFPEKSTLYPELHPFWAHWARGANRYKQIMDTLQGLPLRMVDTTPLLLNHKDQLLYSKRFDLWHFNGRPYPYIYDAIAEHFPAELKSAWRQKGTDFYSITPVAQETFGPTETVPTLHLKFNNNIAKITAKLPHFPDEAWSKEAFKNPDAPPFSLWVSADSYFVYQNPFLGICSETLTLHGQLFNINNIKKLLAERAKPDLVFEAFVERGIGYFWENRTDDPYLRILADALLNTPMHVLDANFFASSKDCYSDRAIAENGGLTLKTDGNCQHVLLPDKAADADGRVALAARINTADNTSVSIFYASGGEDFHPGKVHTVALTKGENYIHVSLWADPGNIVKSKLVFSEVQHIALPIPEIGLIREKNNAF